jgi:septal ring factor EnvC (AmiA/AmiB activator)
MSATIGKIGGFLLTGVLTMGVATASVYSGQEKLNAVQQSATSYSEKTEQVIGMVKNLQTENKELHNKISELQQELDRNWNTVKEVNALIEETKVLRHQISILEEQLQNNSSEQEIEKANTSVEEHLDTMMNILDESVFDTVLNNS